MQSGGLGAASPAEAENRVDAAEPGHRNSSTEILARLWQGHRDAPERSAALAAIEAESPEAIAAFLRERTVREIFDAYAGPHRMGMIDMPKVFGDGHVQPSGPPLGHLARGDYADVPVILGANRDEWKLFIALDPAYTRFLWRLPMRPRDPDRYERDARWRSLGWRLAGVERFIVFDSAEGGGVRMAADTLTSRGVVEGIAADGGFASDADRCQMLRELAERHGGVEPMHVRAFCAR